MPGSDPVAGWKKKWPGASAVMQVMLKTRVAMSAAQVARVVKFSPRCSRKPTKRYIESMLGDAVHLDFATMDEDNRFQFCDERRQDYDVLGENCEMEIDGPPAATTTEEPQTQNPSGSVDMCATSSKRASRRKPRAIARGRVCKPSKAKAKSVALKRKAMPSKAKAPSRRVKTKSKPRKSVAKKICATPAKQRKKFSRVKRCGVTQAKKPKPRARKCKSTDAIENNQPEEKTADQAAVEKSKDTASGFTSMMEWLAHLWKKAMGYSTPPNEPAPAEKIPELTQEQEEELREICRGMKYTDYDTYKQMRQVDFGFEWSSDEDLSDCDEDVEMPSTSEAEPKRRTSSKNIDQKPSKVQKTTKRRNAPKSPARNRSACKDKNKLDESSSINLASGSSTKRRSNSKEITQKSPKAQTKRRNTPKQNDAPFSLNTSDNDDGEVKVLYSSFAPMDSSTSIDDTAEITPSRRRTCMELKKKSSIVPFARRTPKLVPQNLKVDTDNGNKNSEASLLDSSLDWSSWDETNPDIPPKTRSAKQMKKKSQKKSQTKRSQDRTANDNANSNNGNASEVLYLSNQNQVYLNYDPPSYGDDSDSDL
ncbi:hypothetical protein KR074_012231 [Drosophila pseudoananassae]|nr:hypothetical protein KR074_012231 [Drosophila pseudoananassae]